LRVPARAALIWALVFLLAACGGSDDEPEDVVLARSSFKEVVTSELKKEGLEAEGAFGLKVHVQEGSNWVDLVLEDDFARYRRNPERRDAVVAGLVSEAKQRLEDGIGEASFADVRAALMPLLKPRFALRGLPDEPVQTPFPAKLVVIYAVERQNDFTVVSEADARRWGKAPAELHRLALANLLRQTNREQRLLCEPSDGQELCGWASGDGYDATRMIVPELRRQIAGEIGRAIYAVPMENVFIALPFEIATRENTEKLFETKVLRDFTTAPNPVSPKLFVERNGRLVLYS
jgi:hypothetical protein